MPYPDHRPATFEGRQTKARISGGKLLHDAAGRDETHAGGAAERLNAHDGAGVRRVDEVAAAAAIHSVNRRVRPRPDCIMRVRKQGATEFFPRDMKVADSGLMPTETSEIIWEKTA